MVKPGTFSVSFQLTVKPHVIHVGLQLAATFQIIRFRVKRFFAFAIWPAANSDRTITVVVAYCTTCFPKHPSGIKPQAPGFRWPARTGRGYATQTPNQAQGAHAHGRRTAPRPNRFAPRPREYAAAALCHDDPDDNQANRQIKQRVDHPSDQARVTFGIHAQALARFRSRPKKYCG